MSIREQIEELRNPPDFGSDQMVGRAKKAADSLEVLLAVYEAACWLPLKRKNGPITVNKVHAKALQDAIAAVQERENA
jgi:hypothetical protein